MSEKVETVEVLEEVTETKPETKKKRGRGSSPTVNYKASFKSKDEAEKNKPRVQETEKQEDGTEKVISDEVAKGYNLYKVVFTKDIPKGTERFVYARNSDQSVAFVLSEACETDNLEAGPRGRSKKLDPVYLTFLANMLRFKQEDQIKVFLAEEAHAHYGTPENREKWESMAKAMQSA